MPYAILRFQKRKAGGVAACERHNERKKEAYKSNPDIDMERSKDNYHLVNPPRYTYKKEILLAQAKNDPKNANKPDNIIEKMLIGRLNKEMKEICLLDQVYVQDGDLTVAKYVEKVAKETGANLTVKKFVRFETGEGLEKKNEDFAAEVAAQMNA